MDSLRDVIPVKTTISGVECLQVAPGLRCSGLNVNSQNPRTCDQRHTYMPAYSRREGKRNSLVWSIVPKKKIIRIKKWAQRTLIIAHPWARTPKRSPGIGLRGSQKTNDRQGTKKLPLKIAVCTSFSHVLLDC
jgi:hypothetical protein